MSKERKNDAHEDALAALADTAGGVDPASNGGSGLEAIAELDRPVEDSPQNAATPPPLPSGNPPGGDDTLLELTPAEEMCDDPFAAMAAANETPLEELEIDTPTGTEDQADELAHLAADQVEPFTANMSVSGATVEDPLAMMSTMAAASRPKMSASEAIEARKARAAKLKAQQAGQTSIQFRKTAIPLLLVMAGILVVIGIATLVITSGQEEPNALAENRGLFAGLSFFLGVCLIGGAMFFQFEVSRAKKQAAVQAQ